MADADMTAVEEISRSSGRAATPGLTRRRLLTVSAGAIGLAAVATGTYAGAIEPLGLAVTRYALILIRQGGRRTASSRLR